MGTKATSRVIEATVAAAFFVACLDPPRRLPHEGAGASGLGTGGSNGGNGGSGAGTSGGGSSGSRTAGKGGTGGSGAKGGSGARGGSSARGGTGGSTSSGATGGTATGATGGTTGGDTSEGGAAGAVGGEGGVGATGGEGAGGEATGPGTNACDTAVVGGNSVYPKPGAGGVAKPAGVAGNLKVLNWAGYTGAVSFTFDDNPNSQVTNYSLLNSVGVRMTFYLVCSADGGNAVWSTAVADGHELGNHTMHHCMANGASGCWGAYLGVDEEIDQCTTHLKAAFGVPGVYTMASPMGDTNWDVPASQRFLVNRGVSDIAAGVRPNDSTNPFELPCHIAAEAEKAVGGFNVVTDSVVTNGSWRIILNHSLGNNDGYHPVDPNEVVAAMTYARDLGTVWVDSVVNVAAYWRAQKVVAAVAPVTQGSDIVYSWTLPEHFPPGHFLRVQVDGGTVSQCGTALTWDEHGYYEIALDAGSVTISP